ncbi:MAG: T9SS type A sorting domain-containing protein [Chitinophagaceae bacterium]
MKNSYILLIILCSFQTFAQQSVARKWNEAQLQTIREDFARPPVQARNLFHVSLAMYEVWSTYHSNNAHYLLGQTVNGNLIPYDGSVPLLGNDTTASTEQALSFAVYRILKYRYLDAAGALQAQIRFDSLMLTLGYDINDTSTAYASSPAALGNYIAKSILNTYLIDGSNEINNYQNLDYTPSNSPLNPFSNGTFFLNFNAWQPLNIPGALDQNGNPIPSIQTCLAPEWGRVLPFSLTQNNCIHNDRNGNDYPVYYDPGVPPMLNSLVTDSMSLYYKWGHEMVAIWTSQLDPSDSVYVDASPATLGNGQYYPSSLQAQKDFYYKYIEGGDSSKGYTLNPSTNLPYDANILNRADFLRVITQFWADGPNSETPPGHWYLFLNMTSDNPLCERKFEGVGATMSRLEWDIKTYFIMGAAMHDAAIAAWGIKGWYDSPRPVSCIRKMCMFGQSSDPSLPRYHPMGIHLVPNYIELIDSNDAMVGANFEYLNFIKIRTWKGHSAIQDPNNDVAGTDWILGVSFLPYQRKSFVSPPFPGYVSGHSTFSRAGATVLELMTGNAFFPGGLLTTTIPANSGFLVFEKGPSTDVELQWATFKDASDQASLSRIWGGIHPPFDDMKGRLIGEQIGNDAFSLAKNYFNSTILPVRLKSFQGIVNHCAMELSWNVSEEKNVEKYIIEYSTDGLSYEPKFSIAAKQQNTYSCTDTKIDKYNYYRLSEVDLNGKKQTLKNISIPALSCFGVEKIIVKNIFPNPVENNFFVQIEAPSSYDDISIQVSTVQGNIIFSHSLPIYEGLNQFKEDISNLPQGMYQIRIFEGSEPLFSQSILKN